MVRRRPTNSPGGFTLAEILIASSLAALFIGYVYSMYWKAYRHGLSLEARARQDQAAYVMIERIARDLERSQPGGCRFEESSLWIRQLDPPNSNGTPWAQLVGYRKEGERLTRFENDTSLDSAQPFPVDMELQSLWQKRPGLRLDSVATFSVQLVEQSALCELTLQGSPARTYRVRHSFSL